MSASRFNPNAQLDVVGIGNAIVDVLVQTEDQFLEQHGLQKGGMALIDETQAESLYQASGPGQETSGGSVANTMVGIAQLGGRAGFIGRVRDDQLGPATSRREHLIEYARLVDAFPEDEVERAPSMMPAERGMVIIKTTRNNDLNVFSCGARDSGDWPMFDLWSVCLLSHAQS